MSDPEAPREARAAVAEDALPKRLRHEAGRYEYGTNYNAGQLILLDAAVALERAEESTHQAWEIANSADDARIAAEVALANATAKSSEQWKAAGDIVAENVIRLTSERNALAAALAAAQTREAALRDTLAVARDEAEIALAALGDQDRDWAALAADCDAAEAALETARTVEARLRTDLAAARDCLDGDAWDRVTAERDALRAERDRRTARYPCCVHCLGDPICMEMPDGHGCDCPTCDHRPDGDPS